MPEPLTAPKSYFARPDGKVGTLLPIIIGGVVIYFFGTQIGDFLVHAMDNMFNFGATLLASGILLWIALEPRTRNLGFYLYRSAIRWITGQFIEMDPIGVLKTYKERMSGKLSEMETSLTSLKTQRIKVQRLQATKNKEYEDEMRLIARAQQAGDTRTEALEGKQAVRLKTALDKYVGDLNQLTLMITIMDRYYGLCKDQIVDMDREIKAREEDREYSKASQSAVRTAKAILSGLPEKDMWDDSMAVLERQYTEALGEVDNFLDTTKDILSKADLQDAANADVVIKLLDDWQKKNANVSLGGAGNQVTKASIIQDAAAQVAGTAGVVQQDVPRTSYLSGKL